MTPPTRCTHLASARRAPLMLAVIIAVAGIGVESTAWAAAEKSPAPAVKDQLTMLSSGAVRLQGRFGRESNQSISRRILAEDVEMLVKPFRERPDDRLWTSEFWGKWMASAAMAEHYRSDPRLRAKMNGAVRELIATQTPDGYIGSYKDNAHLKFWDVWGRKYVLLGLLAYHELTGDAAALQAARRAADHTLAEIGPGKANIETQGEWVGMAASSILEPMVLLYRRTGDERYLAFARYILDRWQVTAGPDLIRKAQREIPVAQMFPGPKGELGGLSKAYEMMSNFEGLIELHRVTGRPEQREAAEKIFTNILGSEITVAGSGSAHERWNAGRATQTAFWESPLEVCVTVTWMKLAGQLLRLTGESRYFDEIERSAYNALLGSQSADGSWWCHYIPLGGRREHARGQCKIKQNCCVANGPRGLLLVPSLAVMSHAEGPVVNLYETGTADVVLPEGARVRISQKTDYPRNGVVDIGVSIDGKAPGPFALRLRIPGWSKGARVLVNGRPLPPAQAGTYLKIARAWKTGDRVRLILDMSAEVVKAPGTAASGVASAQVAVVRGPIVFALDGRIPIPAGGQGSLRLAPGPVDARVVTAGVPKGTLVALQVPFTAENGKVVPVRMTDYASAGRGWSRTSYRNTLHRVWLPQPLDGRAPFADIPEESGLDPRWEKERKAMRSNGP